MRVFKDLVIESEKIHTSPKLATGKEIFEVVAMGLIIIIDLSLFANIAKYKYYYAFN